jgi:hypothetical protein
LAGKEFRCLDEIFNDNKRGLNLIFMDAQEKDLLLEELEQYRKERAHVKKVVGQIGGKDSRKKTLFINLAFILAIFFLFIVDLLRHVSGLAIVIPPLFSITLGILLISCKIIWMIHKQTKVEHFQFWILNSIEFRLNNLTHKVNHLQRLLDESK